MLPQLYHAHHSRDMQDLPFWLELAAQVGGPLLELGCGTGRLLLPLARAGYRCVGLDHDPAMLKFLQAQINSQLKPAPWLVIADISRFNFGVRFPLIILPCNTLSTLDEDRRRACLGCVGKHIALGGIFAVSLPNPETLAQLLTSLVPEVEDEFIYPQTGNPVQVSSSWRRTGSTFYLTWIYDHLLSDGRVDRFSIETIHHILPVDGYLRDFRAAGLRIMGVYGDFDRSAYTNDSPTLIILASA